jgi:hypothetical protein
MHQTITGASRWLRSAAKIGKIDLLVVESVKMPPHNHLTTRLSGPSPLTIRESMGTCLALGSIIGISVAALLFRSSSVLALGIALCMVITLAAVGVASMTVAPWLRLRRKGTGGSSQTRDGGSDAADIS